MNSMVNSINKVSGLPTKCTDGKYSYEWNGIKYYDSYETVDGVLVMPSDFINGEIYYALCYDNNNKKFLVISSERFYCIENHGFNDAEIGAYELFVKKLDSVTREDLEKEGK